jgi:hypothetical protein
VQDARHLFLLQEPIDELAWFVLVEIRPLLERQDSRMWLTGFRPTSLA